MSERKPLLKWVSRERRRGVRHIEEFNTDPACKVYVAEIGISDGLFYEVWAENFWAENGTSLYRRHLVSRSLNEALLYAEKVIAETDPEFYMQQVLSTEATDVTDV